MDRKNNSGCLSVLQRIFNVKPSTNGYDTAYEGFERFQVKRNFFHPTEVEFYRVLKKIIKDKYVIFSQVGMGGLFSVGKGKGVSWKSLRNRIESKRIDFILCDPITLQPMLAIELDGSSHNRSDRKKGNEESGVFSNSPKSDIPKLFIQ